MKQFIFVILAFAIGCAQKAPSVQPAVGEATGLKLAFQITFVIENAQNRPIGCASLLAVEQDCFWIAAPLEPASQTACQIVEWRGEHDGQKFQRSVFDKYDVLASEPSLKLAIVRVLGSTSKQVIALAHTERREFRSTFDAFGSRASQPRPVEAMAVKVSGLTTAQAAPNLPSNDFFQVESGLDFKMLGSPLVTQQGELAAVAVGNFWNSTLYCPATSIKKLLSKARDETGRPIGDGVNGK